MRRRTLVMCGALGWAVLTGCGLGGAESAPVSVTAPPVEQGERDGATAPPGTAGAAGSGTSADACEPGPGKHVEHLPDLTIPAVDAPEVRVPDEVVGGETVPGFVVPAVRIPETVIDTGCIIRYDAPGGCLGAVEITGVELPGVELPGVEIPAVAVGGKQYEGKVVASVRQGPVSAPPARAEQRCQAEPRPGAAYVGPVLRGPIMRQQRVRNQIVRPHLYRPALCVGGECTDLVDIPSVIVEGVVVPAEVVDAEVLEAELLGDTRVLRGDDETSYLAPADVLFDFDKATLRPEATPALRAIVAEIETQSGASLSVEGHTDDKGDDAYNQRLSEERAETVAAWLRSEGGIDASRITAQGHGEAVPAAPNRKPDGSDDPEGRQRNRRVVITARRG